MKDLWDVKLKELREAIKHSSKELEQKEYVCSLCQDRGLIYRDGLAYRCTCVQKRQMDLSSKKAHLSGEYKEKHFDDFRLDYYASKPYAEDKKGTYRQSANQSLQAAKLFTELVIAGEMPKGLYLYGNVGSGKTLLASCIANQLIESRQEVLFVSIPDLLDELKDTFNGRTGNELALMNRVRKAKTLIMDDLGAHMYTDWTAGRIYNIINYRASHNLSTIITSNLTVDELRTALDERTSSRILQLCQIYRLQSDQDIRRQVYIENLKSN